jgi:hypothetical protein
MKSLGSGREKLRDPSSKPQASSNKRQARQLRQATSHKSDKRQERQATRATSHKQQAASVKHQAPSDSRNLEQDS